MLNLGWHLNCTNYNGFTIQIDGIYEWECFPTQAASLFDIVLWITSLKTWLILQVIFCLRPKSCCTQQLTYIEKPMCKSCRCLSICTFSFGQCDVCTFQIFLNLPNQQILSFFGEVFQFLSGKFSDFFLGSILS